MQYSPGTHQYWMSKAIKFASEVKDEVPVCALIVKDNELISQTTNQIEKLKDATAHAEILAIRDASEKLADWRLNDCVLYITLEPCVMCTGAIFNSRISKVVFGAYDLNLGACGFKINLLNDLGKNDQVEVVGGILEIEASKLLKDFFLTKRN